VRAAIKCANANNFVATKSVDTEPVDGYLFISQ